jgi:hypothetical protein
MNELLNLARCFSAKALSGHRWVVSAGCAHTEHALSQWLTDREWSRRPGYEIRCLIQHRAPRQRNDLHLLRPQLSQPFGSLQ